jgi:ribosomal protein S18 acetylase RimI-like enzyme
MDITYREAKPEDAAALLKHIKTVGGETDNLSYSSETFNISEEKESRFINRFCKSENDIMYVACDGDLIVGNAIVERNRIERYKHRAEITVTVMRDYWGQGIGSKLMQMMIDFAVSKNIEILYLEVRADNERALSLYKKFGYSEIGVFKRFFKIDNSYFDAVLMELMI